MRCNEFYIELWRNYISLCPTARIIHRLFEADGNVILNDHVAFRTFNHSVVSISALESVILDMGYKRLDTYTFDDKHLDACAYIHADLSQPKVFLSELRVNALSEKAQTIIRRLLADIVLTKPIDADIFLRDDLWVCISLADYETLLLESEYAAWLAVFGLRANHFTVNVNALNGGDMAYVINALNHAGIPLNDTGGVLKGSKDVCLVQSATLADEVDVVFSDGARKAIPACFYEFAERFKDSTGAIYQGFVPANADKIFHSTDVKK